MASPIEERIANNLLYTGKLLKSFLLGLAQATLPLIVWAGAHPLATRLGATLEMAEASSHIFGVTGFSVTQLWRNQALAGSEHNAIKEFLCSSTQGLAAYAAFYFIFDAYNHFTTSEQGSSPSRIVADAGFIMIASATANYAGDIVGHFTNSILSKAATSMVAEPAR